MPPQTGVECVVTCVRAEIGRLAGRSRHAHAVGALCFWSQDGMACAARCRRSHFFVLSGYLITRILLQERRLSPLESARRFYSRRIRRLSPALYMAIAATAAIGLANMRSDWWVHALYLTNFQIALTGEWGPAGHFWSLSVEEQFYIFWIFIITFCTIRQMKWVIAWCVVLAVFFRLLIVLSVIAPHAGWLLPGSMHYLAIGALFGSFEFEKSYSELRLRLASPWIIGASLCLLGLALSFAPRSVPVKYFTHQL